MVDVDDSKSSELERRVHLLSNDLREALRVGDPSAVHAIDELVASARALLRERRALAEGAEAHRAQDDEVEDEAGSHDPAT